jgi:glycosyltransferase involved in cell wall biosynthesis
VKIAVIIPTFDRPVRLEQALASVASQSRVPEEVHVVIDGGPPLAELHDRFGGRLPLTIHRLIENRGQAAARNYALARTEADAVAFLDDDDLFLERHLERLERTLREDPSLALVYDDCEILREADPGEGGEPEIRRIARDYDPVLMRHHDYIPPACWLARSDAMARAGGFDDTLRCYEDWDLLLRLEVWGGVLRAPGPGAAIRIGSGNQSLDVDRRRLDALERFQAKHGLAGIEPLTFWEVAAAVHGWGRRKS